MSIKEHAKSCLYNFFVITALVNIAMFVLGSIYRPEAALSYDAFLYPPIYGFLGTLPEWILYSKKELTTAQMLIRKIMQVVVLEIMLILFTFMGGGMVRENIPVIVSFGISVFIIYVLVLVISWVLDGKKAKIIMKDIESYQKEINESFGL